MPGCCCTVSDFVFLLKKFSVVQLISLRKTTNLLRIGLTCQQLVVWCSFWDPNTSFFPTLYRTANIHHSLKLLQGFGEFLVKFLAEVGSVGVQVQALKSEGCYNSTSQNQCLSLFTKKSGIGVGNLTNVSASCLLTAGERSSWSRKDDKIPVHWMKC